MSKFFATNNAEWYNAIKNNVEKSPFKVSGDYQKDGFYAISTYKLLVENDNFYQNGKDLIIQTGTCVYHEVSGEPALKLALENYNGNLESHREDYLGNYGCLIKKGNDIVIFNEGAGFYDVFYYSKDDKWLVGTTVIDIAKVLADIISVNKMNVMEELTRFAIFGNETYFNEIKRLSGDQYLELSSTSLSVKALNLRINQTCTIDSETRVKDIAKDMKYVAGVMSKNFGQTTLGCTGGFDSRMTLAAYLSAGIKPKIAYGYGNSRVADSKVGDVEVNKEYSNRYGLDFHLAAWNETHPLDKLWDEYIQKFGRLIYDGCEDTYSFYTNKDELFLSFGYMGEFYRESDWSKAIEPDNMTLDDYLWKNHADIFNKNIIEACPILLQHWIKKWRKLNEEHGILSDNFKKEDLFWINLAYRHSADSHMVNIINQYKYAHYLMSEIIIIRNSYLNFEEKYNGRFMIKILKELYPDILQVPFFSHCQKMKFNESLMQLEQQYSIRLRSFISSFFPNSIKLFIKKLLKRDIVDTSYMDEVMSLLYKDENDMKLRKLVGENAFKAIIIQKNHSFLLRGIILCKTFDYLGIHY